MKGKIRTSDSEVLLLLLRGKVKIAIKSIETLVNIWYLARCIEETYEQDKNTHKSLGIHWVKFRLPIEKHAQSPKILEFYHWVKSAYPI